MLSLGAEKSANFNKFFPGSKINMTTPVLMKFDGSEDQPTSRVRPYQMSFYTPSDYHDKAPQPNDASVYLSTTPGMTVYVR